MTSPLPESGPSVDAMGELLAAWTLGDEDPRASERPARGSGGTHDARNCECGQHIAQRDQPRQSLVLLEAFNLPGSANDTPTPRDVLSTIHRQRLATPGTDGRGGIDGRGSRTNVPRQGLPQPGDELAGFRIVLELGRGAFARVYLAEELNLGRRLVAIKVSRPDNDEPWILARLQHAHIVPVHSVCDDPSTGLRVLCMPYFGGADLAQVLRAAGGLVPSRHDGGSLVKALEQVSRRLPEQTGLSLAPQRSHPPRSLHPDNGAAPSAPAVSTSRTGQSSSRALRLGWRLFRRAPAQDASYASEEAPGLLHDEPSLRFLGRASAIQAAVWIVARLAEGLDHAHSRGLLHRDLKPSNVLLAADGTPMLLDFNLAVESRLDSPEGEVHRAMIGGTLPYMSPEHLEAFNVTEAVPATPVDARSDIYALGLILFELLTGAPPFPDAPPGLTLLETLESMIVCRRHPPSPRARSAQIPWSLDALTAKCIAFDPAHRYARARDLADDLRRFLENLPMKHCPEPSWKERMGKWARRHPALCGSTSIAFCTTLLLAMLAGSLALVYDNMQALSARVRYRVFDQDFTEIQFLLNTTGESNEHLKQGLAKATQTLEQSGAETSQPGRWGDWARRLTRDERRRLGEQIVELIMLDARAQVLLASQEGTNRERLRAIERAIARLERVERAFPAVPAALFAERASYHAALGAMDHARRDRQRARQITPTSCHDLTLLATTLLSGGDRLGAEQVLEQALRVDVTSFWAWFVLGHCHYAQGRYVEAAGDFAACAVRGPNFAWVHFNRGLALARAGRPLEARHAYDRALALEPAFSEALVNRAMVEIELDELDLAERDLVRSIELGRHDLVALTSLGETWARRGRRSQAEQYFARLIARNPRSLDVYVARGFTRIASDPEAARGDLTHVLDHQPRHAHALYGLALLARGQDLKEALAFLDRSLESDPNLIDAVQLRALVRARLGDPAALDDADRLVASPTATHLYNAACAVAIYSQKARQPRLVHHALELLSRAIQAGFPPSEAAADPDLAPLHDSALFTRLVSERKAR